MVRHRLDSVNDFSTHGYNLRISCRVCDHVVDASAIEMTMELLRRNLPRSIDLLEDRMKCQKCGWRGANISAVEAKF